MYNNLKLGTRVLITFLSIAITGYFAFSNTRAFLGCFRRDVLAGREKHPYPAI
jgi:hypothetical protein